MLWHFQAVTIKFNTVLDLLPLAWICDSMLIISPNHTQESIGSAVPFMKSICHCPQTHT